MEGLRVPGNRDLDASEGFLMAKSPLWPDKVSAPPEALELYRLIAMLQDSEAFTVCHVYHGADLAGVPYIKWERKSTNLAYVIGTFLGIPFTRKSCPTVGCCNPFHYTMPEGAMSVPEELFSAPIGAPPAGTNAMVDNVAMLEWVMDSQDAPLEFHALRALIPEEDMADHTLNLTIQNMRNLH